MTKKKSSGRLNEALAGIGQTAETPRTSEKPKAAKKPRKVENSKTAETPDIAETPKRGRPATRPADHKKVTIAITAELWAALGTHLARLTLQEVGEYRDKSEAVRALIAKLQRGEIDLTAADIQAVR